MDYRIYDPILYPVFVVANNDAILYANSAGLFWLSKMTNYMPSGSFKDHVSFSGISLADMVKDSAPLQRLPYKSMHFRLVNRAHEGVCEVSAMKLSGDKMTFNFAVFIYDKATLQESEAVAAATIAPPAPVAAQPVGEERVTPVGLAGAAVANTGVLSMNAFAGLLPDDRMASIVTKANIFCVDLKIPVFGQTVWITETWIEAVIKSVGIKTGHSCSIEIADLGGKGPFAAKAKVIQVLDQAIDQMVRFQFEGLSALNKRTLEAYLQENIGK